MPTINDTTTPLTPNKDVNWLILDESYTNPRHKDHEETVRAVKHYFNITYPGQHGRRPSAIVIDTTRATTPKP